MVSGGRVGVVGPDGRPGLPWLEPLLRRTLAAAPVHALLLHGPEGVGQFELAVALAQAGLCESGIDGAVGAFDAVAAVRPCGHCAGCRLVQSGSHPDLLVIVPEALGEALGWSRVDDDAGGEARASKAKPSTEIKVAAVRGAVGFAQTTAARGRGKAVVLFPAERMNAVAANTLLKTLEEPPGDARFLLATAAPDALLPTVRSRCRGLALPLPARDAARAWLQAEGVADAEALLQATGGRPSAALALAGEGVDSGVWAALPAAIARGDATLLAGWPLPRAVDTLLKLCEDLASVAVGAPARWFPPAALPAGDLPALLEWHRELLRAARHAGHPWNAGLMVDALVAQAGDVWRPKATRFAAPPLPARR